jgi:serine/threonine protein kinase
VAEIIRFDPGDGPRPDNGDAALDAALAAADEGMLAAISSNLDLDGGLDRILENPPPHAAGRFSAGSQLAGYRLEERIGRGGMAQVFRAWDERLDRQVALKILGPELAEDPVFRERFIRESRATAAVQHPHIIPVFEAGEASSVLFIAMPLINGGDAGSFVRRNGPLPPDRVAEIVSQVASALDAAHAKGLVHRDVKPANMLLAVRPGLPDHVYLSDFGLAKAPLAGGLTVAGQFLGTADYAAPEQVSGQPVDGRTDQYALGCSAFELLCGEPPFRREQMAATVRAHPAGPPPLATSQLPGLPFEVDRVFARVLARSPADRYGTCQEFAEALRRALGLRPYAADPGGTPQERPANPVSPERATDPLNGPAAPRNGVSPTRSGDTRPLGSADDPVRGAGIPPAAPTTKKIRAPAGTTTKRKRGKRGWLTSPRAIVIAAIIGVVGPVVGVVIAALLSHGPSTPAPAQTPIAAATKSATPSTHPPSAPTNIGHMVEWVNGGGHPNTSWLVGSNGERYWIPTTSIFSCLVKEGHTDRGPQSSTVLNALPDSGQWASCPATVNRAAYIGHIVEWVNSGGQPHTSWLVGSNGERYWIPDTTIFFCLVNEGHTDLGPQSSTVLDDLPDLGQRASC